MDDVKVGDWLKYHTTKDDPGGEGQVYPCIVTRLVPNDDGRVGYDVRIFWGVATLEEAKRRLADEIDRALASPGTRRH